MSIKKYLCFIFLAACLHSCACQASAGKPKWRNPYTQYITGQTRQNNKKQSPRASQSKRNRKKVLLVSSLIIAGVILYIATYSLRRPNWFNGDPLTEMPFGVFRCDQGIIIFSIKYQDKDTIQANLKRLQKGKERDTCSVCLRDCKFSEIVRIEHVKHKDQLTSKSQDRICLNHVGGYCQECVQHPDFCKQQSRLCLSCQVVVDKTKPPGERRQTYLMLGREQLTNEEMHYLAASP